MALSLNPSSAGDLQIEQEAMLESDLQFSAEPSRFPYDPRAVFLTGATGLLGVYLLDELLRRTHARIYCLARADDEAAASRRLTAHLESYGLWDPAQADRIVPVVGDLSRERFGLDDAVYRDLAETVDVIYHSAGWINMLYPYAKLKPANVGGVREILRLSACTRTKPLHFVSSIAVFFSDAWPKGRILRESDTPQYHDSLKGGYAKSKWVGDRLVAEAQRRGLPASIYRPIRIMGHSQTGALNDTSELLPQLIKGCIRMGVYPAWDIEITLVPVDFISKAMVHLAGAGGNFGKCYHFFNPRPIRWRDLMRLFIDRGYPMTELSCGQWNEALKSLAVRDKSVEREDKKLYSSLFLALSAPHYLFYQRPPFDVGNLSDGLKDADIRCPPVDGDLVSKYIAYWRKSGFLPEAVV